MEGISKKIRYLRLYKGMTLKDLSEATDLSISFLSQLERGCSSLAITSLKKISNAFNINITYFFNRIENINYSVYKSEQKPFKLEGSNVEYVRLAGKFSDRNMEPMLVTLPPKLQYMEKYSHPGEEFYYVMTGTVIFRVDNEEHILNSGDSIQFPSEVIHEWRNPNDEQSVLLSILTPTIF